MPIEIRELIIKATVVQDNDTGIFSGNTSSSNNAVTPAEELINICLEKMIEIEKDKNER